MIWATLVGKLQDDFPVPKRLKALVNRIVNRTPDNVDQALEVITDNFPGKVH